MSGKQPGGHPGSDALRQWQVLHLSKVELELQQNALAALQQSADEARSGAVLYARLFEQVPACCYALDGAGRILGVNQAGAELLGQSAGALQGQPFERYLAPEQQPHWRAFASAGMGGSGRAGMASQLFEGIPGAGAVWIAARFDTASGLCCLVLTPRAGQADDIAASAAREAEPELQHRIGAEVAARTAALEQANALLRLQLAERSQEGRDLRAEGDQLRLLGEHEADAVELSRARLARTVHDAIGQNLLALRLDVSMLNQRTLHHHPLLHQRASAALSNVDETLRTVRGLMNQLRPPVLDLGLQAAIDWLLADFRQRSGLACTLDAPDGELFERIDNASAVMLFRQLQSALVSVQGDASASAVVIGLRLQDGVAQLTVTDDGTGEGGEDSGARGRQGQALRTLAIAERLRARGGTLEVAYGVAGQGCRLKMRLPLAPPVRRS